MAKKLKTWFLSLGSLLALCNCTGADILNVFTPRSGYQIHRAVAYGQNARQQLDIYVPDIVAPSAPVMVFFYGGSWQTGSKEEYKFVGQAFASKGFVTVIADYRLYPEVYFPTFMEDAAQAFTWVHKHIGEYGGNPENMFVSGHSSGGYIAVMLTTNASYLTQAGGSLAWIKGTIGISGPYDFLPMTDPKIIAVFSKAASPIDTQPITYVRPNLPPMLLLTGDEDTKVRPHNTYSLADKLKHFGNEVTVHTIPVWRISVLLFPSPMGFAARHRCWKILLPL